MVITNHIIACAWFLCADLQQSDGDKVTWIRVTGYGEKDWVHLYLTAFHWSLTQLMPASMEVVPQNLVERTFAVCVVVIAFIAFSYLLGTITGLLQKLRN